MNLGEDFSRFSNLLQDEILTRFTNRYYANSDDINVREGVTYARRALMKFYIDAWNYEHRVTEYTLKWKWHGRRRIDHWKATNPNWTKRNNQQRLDYANVWADCQTGYKSYDPNNTWQFNYPAAMVEPCLTCYKIFSTLYPRGKEPFYIWDDPFQLNLNIKEPEGALPF